MSNFLYWLRLDVGRRAATVAVGVLLVVLLGIGVRAWTRGPSANVSLGKQQAESRRVLDEAVKADAQIQGQKLLEAAKKTASQRSAP